MDDAADIGEAEPHDRLSERGGVDTDADFSAYVDSRFDSLVRSARLLGCSATDAEDVVQAALVRCYRSWDKVRQAHSPDAYVYRTLVNSLNSSRKRRWWGEVPTVEVESPASPDFADDAAERTSLAVALASLGEAHRAVLVLRFYADLSEQQTADALGIRAGTVKSRVSRALAQLSTRLDVARAFSTDQEEEES